MKGFGKLSAALKIGYKVLNRYEVLEAAGLVPALKIKNVPVSVIHNAADAFVHTVKDAHDASATSEPKGRE